MTFTSLLIPDWDFYKGFSTSENRTGTVLDLKEALENHHSYECKCLDVTIMTSDNKSDQA